MATLERFPQPRRAVVAQVDIEAFGPQPSFENIADRFVILDHQNPHEPTP